MPLSGVPYGPVFHSPRNGASMRRTTKVGAAAASLALLLAACSSGSDTATDGHAPRAQRPQRVRAPSRSGPTRSGPPPIKAECDKFAEANGITCEVVQIDFGDIRAKVVQGNQTGDVPDLFIGAHDWLGELVTNGVVTPFDLGAKSSSFSEVAVKAVAYDGKSYGVPYAVENIAMLTNPELSPECPASLDDLVSQGEALLKDKQGLAPACPADRRQGRRLPLVPAVQRRRWLHLRRERGRHHQRRRHGRRQGGLHRGSREPADDG